MGQANRGTFAVTHPERTQVPRSDVAVGVSGNGADSRPAGTLFVPAYRTDPRFIHHFSARAR